MTSAGELLPALASWAADTGAEAALTADTTHPPVLRIITSGPSTPQRCAEGASVLSPLSAAHGVDIIIESVAGTAGNAATGSETGAEASTETGATGDAAENPADNPRARETPPPSIGLSAPEVMESLSAGEDLVDRAVDAGERLLLFSTDSTPIAVSAIAGTVCRAEPVSVVTQGVSSDLGDIDGWRRQVLAVRDAMFRARGYRNGPWDSASVREILRILGTPELAATVGALIRASARRTPVILDGVETVVAALLAEACAPGSAEWWLLPHIPQRPAGGVTVRKLGLTPVFDRDLGVPPGGAGLVVLPLLQAAVALWER